MRAGSSPRRARSRLCRPLGVTLNPLSTLPLLLWRAASSPRLTLGSARRRTQLVILVMSEYYIIVKTFNNGSLGSGIDEERSEMR